MILKASSFDLRIIIGHWLFIKNDRIEEKYEKRLFRLISRRAIQTRLVSFFNVFLISHWPMLIVECMKYTLLRFLEEHHQLSRPFPLTTKNVKFTRQILTINSLVS